MVGGRQREFDETTALDAAMKIFWKKGYLGASLSDLTAAMGINKPSMYAAFGNKEALFVKATEHYLNVYAASHGAKLIEKGLPLKDRLAAYMLSALTAQCDAEAPKGCYISLCVSETEADQMPIEANSIVEYARDFGHDFLVERFEIEKAAGALPESCDVNALALYLITLLSGTASMARGGCGYEELKQVVLTAMSAIEFSNRSD